MGKKTKDDMIYLDSYLLQKDYRIRLPKLVESNLGIIPGKTFLDIYMDTQSKELVIRISDGNDKENN